MYIYIYTVLHTNIYSWYNFSYFFFLITKKYNKQETFTKKFHLNVVF